MAHPKAETIGERAERELAELAGTCAAAEAEIVRHFHLSHAPGLEQQANRIGGYRASSGESHGANHPRPDYSRNRVVNLSAT